MRARCPLPPTLFQVYRMTDGFASSKCGESGGVSGSVLRWQGLHGQLKFLVDTVTHSTSLWGVVYFSLPVENVFLFGSGEVACPGFGMAARAELSGLDLLALTAEESSEEGLPRGAEWHDWALPAWLVFTEDVTALQGHEKKKSPWILRFQKTLNSTEFATQLILSKKIPIRKFPGDGSYSE